MKNIIANTLISLGLATCYGTDLSNHQVFNFDESARKLMNKEFSVTYEIDISGKDLSESYKRMRSIDYDDNLPKIFSYSEKKIKKYGRYRIARVVYSTKDEKDKDVNVSALIVYPVDKVMDKIMLINHGTGVGNILIPTYFTSPEVTYAKKNALCIMPDYIGFGESKAHKELYLNSKISGQTSTDALLVLFSYAIQKKLTLSSDYCTYVLGYSQGGEVSLASLRTIQTLSKERQEIIRLRKVICGEGPYDIKATFEQYMEDDKKGKKLGFAVVLPRVVSCMFESYPEEYSKFRYEDFFTAKALETGVPQAIRENKATPEDMAYKLSKFKASDVFDMNYFAENKEAFDTFMETMERQSLCVGWEIKYPVQLMHCKQDGVVPYKNFENLMKGAGKTITLKPDRPSSFFIPFPLLKHIYGGIIFSIYMANDRYLR